ncbi:hypothetical protein [Saliphagus sp. LR7]|uniref:DUF7344 domain-containing protein n=1 Tax=Saliphagus sp. LR7 TaxID=2282654 RepID=UPI000DF7222D|nr:hypothetical protein [Saliphagus sp. LR7]
MTLDHQTNPTNVVLELVTDQCRRKVLHYLIAAGNQPVTLDELTDGIYPGKTPPESGVQPSPLDSRYDSKEHLTLALQHSHLPKLEAAGVIEYDTRSRIVRYHSTPRLETLLAFIANELE